MRVKDMRITQDLALPATKEFIEAANAFESSIKLCSEDGTFEIDAKSILGLASLFVKKNSVITLKAAGPDEEEAVKKLSGLIEKLLR